MPLDEGGLTGKITPDTTFPEGDWRNNYFGGDRKQQVYEGAQPSRGACPMVRSPASRFCSRTSWWHTPASLGAPAAGSSERDSAAMLDATAGPEVGALYVAPSPARPFLDEVGTDPGRLRIAFTPQPLFGDYVHEDCVEGLRATVRLLEDLGHDLVEASPAVDGPAMAGAFLSFLAPLLKAEIEEAEAILGRRATPDDFEEDTWAAARAGGEMSAPAFVHASRLLQRGARQFSRFFETCDAFLTPRLGIPPAETGSLQETWNRSTRWCRSCHCWSTPAASRLCRCRCTGTTRGCLSGCTS